MKTSISWIIAPALGFMTLGCAVSLPFNHRLNYSAVSVAKGLPGKGIGPIAIQWEPSDFPDRIDIQGASGFVGGGSRTRIPTGQALAQRITEVLDSSIGVASGAPARLTITILSADSTFQYSAGFFNVTPALDRGGCTLTAKFAYGSQQWEESFSSQKKDPKVGGTSQTGVLEAAWDDVALQVGQSVVQHLAPPVPPAPPAAPPADALKNEKS